jgi:hypothetical protein
LEIPRIKYSNRKSSKKGKIIYKWRFIAGKIFYK